MAQLTIQAPLAGIVRGRGFQKQPPFSSRDSINFWPQFVFDGSQTLGVRPPLDEYIAVATNPVNLLCRVNGTTADTPQRTFVAGINGALFRWDGSALVACGGAGTIPTGRAAFAAPFEQKVYIPAATPLVYDYPSDTLSTWTATSGTVPADMRILVYWAGGLWGAAQPDQPHVVSGCKTGAPLDWNFNGTTPTSAFSTIGDNAGLISDPVCALVPVSGDTMIVSGPDSMQAWRGHPRRGGVADVLSNSIGIRGQGAWAQGSDGTIFALTNRGLVAIQNASVISLISDDRIPSDLIGLDYDFLDPRVSMAYDARFNGVHITVRDGDDSEGWFYDLKHGGLHQSEFAQYPYVMLRFDPIGSGRASEVLFGGSGGLYRHDLDGSESYACRIVMGPMKLSNNATERSMIREANVVLGGGTTAVDAKVALYCGPTPDSAYAAAVSGNAVAKYETTIDDVFLHEGRLRPMIAGHACTMVIEQEAAMTNPKIMFEEANLQLAPAGKERGFVQHSDTSGPRAGSFTSPGVDLTDFFAAFNFSEASGTRADLSANNLDLSTTPGDDFSNDTGKSGNGMALVAPGSGANSKETADPSGVTIDPDLGITIAFWMKRDASADTDYTTATIHFRDASDITELELKTALNFLVGTLFTAGDDVQVTNSAADFSDDAFHLCVAYYDPATQTVGVGFDNVFETADAGSHNGTSDDAQINVQINTGSGSGVIDELYIWNRYIGTPGCNWLWNSGAGRFAPSFS